MRITFDMNPTWNNLKYFEDFILKINPEKAPEQPVINTAAAMPETVQPVHPMPEPCTEIASAELKAESADTEKYSLSDVRALALKWSKAKKQKELAEIFAKFNAKKLSDIAEVNYSELYRELVKIDG